MSFVENNQPHFSAEIIEIGTWDDEGGGGQQGLKTMWIQSSFPASCLKNKELVDTVDLHKGYSEKKVNIDKMIKIFLNQRNMIFWYNTRKFNEKKAVFSRFMSGSVP